MKNTEHRTGIKIKAKGGTVTVTVDIACNHVLSNAEKIALHKILSPRLRGFVCSLPDCLAPEEILMKVEEQ